MRIDHATFVSLLISREAVRAVGYPLQWMFIWGEDFEFTRRISGLFKGWAVLDSKAVHKTTTAAGDAYADPNFRKRSLYRLRNEIFIVKTNPHFGRFGRLLGILNSFYQAGLLILKRKMPIRSILWVLDGLCRRPRYEYPGPADDVRTSEGHS